MRRVRVGQAIAVSFTAGVLLVGCGGGDSDSSDASDQPNLDSVEFERYENETAGPTVAPAESAQ